MHTLKILCITFLVATIGCTSIPTHTERFPQSIDADNSEVWPRIIYANFQKINSRLWGLVWPR